MLTPNNFFTPAEPYKQQLLPQQIPTQPNTIYSQQLYFTNQRLDQEQIGQHASTQNTLTIRRILRAIHEISFWGCLRAMQISLQIEKIDCVHLRCKAPLLENASHISGSNVFEITAKFKHHTYKSLRSNFIPSCCYCLFTRTGTIAERHGTVLSRNSNCHKCLEPSRRYQTNIPKRQKYT